MGPRNLVVQGRQLKECNRLSFFFRAYAERVRTLGIIDPRKSTIPGAWIPASQPEWRPDVPECADRAVRFGRLESRGVSGPCGSTVSLLTVVPGGGARMGPRSPVVQGGQLEGYDWHSSFLPSLCGGDTDIRHYRSSQACHPCPAPIAADRSVGSDRCGAKPSVSEPAWFAGSRPSTQPTDL